MGFAAALVSVKVGGMSSSVTITVRDAVPIFPAVSVAV